MQATLKYVVQTELSKYIWELKDMQKTTTYNGLS